MAKAEDVLGSKGEKLHTHEMHIRRIADGKYIASHQMRNKRGEAPSDPRRSTREHSLDDHKALAAHVAAAMAPDPDAEDEAGEMAGSPENEPGEAGGAVAGGATGTAGV
jgi:hypothetical protein